MIQLCMQGQLLSFNDDSAYIDLVPSQASLIHKVQEYASNTRRKVKILNQEKSEIKFGIEELKK